MYRLNEGRMFVFPKVYTSSILLLSAKLQINTPEQRFPSHYWPKNETSWVYNLQKSSDETGDTSQGRGDGGGTTSGNGGVAGGDDGRDTGSGDGGLGAVRSELASGMFFLFAGVSRVRTYQSWQTTSEVVMMGLVMVQGQSVMVRVVASVTV